MSDKINVKKSYRDGHVALGITLNDRSVKVAGSTDLSTSQARDLARSLIAEADRADAKVAAKSAKEDRRKKWRDREVAAGRIKIMDAGSFFKRQQTPGA